MPLGTAGVIGSGVSVGVGDAAADVEGGVEGVDGVSLGTGEGISMGREDVLPEPDPEGADTAGGGVRMAGGEGEGEGLPPSRISTAAVARVARRLTSAPLNSASPMLRGDMFDLRVR